MPSSAANHSIQAGGLAPVIWRGDRPPPVDQNQVTALDQVAAIDWQVACGHHHGVPLVDDVGQAGMFAAEPFPASISKQREDLANALPVPVKRIAARHDQQRLAA